MFLAAGVFDGFHLGHRAVVERAVAEAASVGGSAVAVTFDPHPVAILRPENAPPLLTSTRHKLRLIAAAGVAHALVIEFTREFSSHAPEDFVRQLASACHPLGGICVGEDWAFGKGRSGNVALLTRLGTALGFRATGIPAVEVAGMPVSSTAIRAAVESGDLAAASALLGRDFSVLGSVTEGRKLGRGLGFPTANLRPESEQLPPNGVYAVRTTIDGTTRDGIANVGVRPTVAGDGAQRLVEVHLFDFTGDLYGQDIEVAFRSFVRPEKKFPDIEALRTQIASDVAAVRAARGH